MLYHFFAVFIFYFLFCINFAFAVRQDTLTAPPIDPSDTLTNQNNLIINSIVIEGNKITKEKIVARELSFKVNDTIASGELSEKLVWARRNLLNTALFNFVTIIPTIKNNFVDIKISVIERWYFFPVPLLDIADPNFSTWLQTSDWSRVNYGMYLTRNNFRGRKELLRLKIQLGYTEQLLLQYSIPYLNKKQTMGLNFITNYSRNHQIHYKTEDNKRIFLTDNNDFVREEFYSKIIFSLRQKIYNTHSIQMKYNSVKIQDSVAQKNNDYLSDSRTKSAYLTISYNFKRDRRNIKAYPLKGYYFEMQATKVNENIYSDLIFFQGEYDHYFKINNKLFFASGMQYKLSSTSQQPYYLQGGLGYYDWVRGYEYYLIDGQNWYLGKSNLKYQLIAPRVKKINFTQNQKFNTLHYAAYLNLFADAGFVQDDLYSKQNPLANNLMLGYGLGLDFVTYYDQVIRVEYAINKLKQSGVYISFSVSI